MKTLTALLLTATLSFSYPALAGTKVYIPMGGANEVIIIDGEKDKIIGSIKDVAGSHGLAGNSKGTYLIAGSLNEVKVGSEALQKPVEMAPDEHDAHHAGSAAVAVTKTGLVSYLTLIRTKDNVVERQISVPGAVHHTLITPDDKYAIATHQGEGAVSIVDLKTFEVKTVQTGPVPNYVVSSPDGNYIYVSNAGNDTISVIDTKRWIVRNNIEVGETPEHLVISADGKSLYVNNVDDGTVSVISLPSNSVEKTYVIGGNIHGIDLSQDENTLFIAGREENKLVSIDLRTGQLTSQPLSPAPYHLTAIKGTSKLYISSAEDDKIWVVDQKTLKAIKEIPVSDRAHQMVVFQN
ncbi:MAG: hypothetical protein COB59_04565 [Rhodospirillaceae bacterium]|nr:MAG: hypothetical protein COB59_04565 [Rhodospirillaceae bacterium]